MRVYHCRVYVSLHYLSACWCYCLSSAEKETNKGKREGIHRGEVRKDMELERGDKERRGELCIQNALPEPRGSDAAAAASAFRATVTDIQSNTCPPEQQIKAANVGNSVHQSWLQPGYRSLTFHLTCTTAPELAGLKRTTNNNNVLEMGHVS